MKLKGIRFLIGLTIGVLIGGVLVGMNDALRTSLFGEDISVTPVVNRSNVRSGNVTQANYFLVPIEETENWLASDESELDADLKSSLETLKGIPDASDQNRYISENQDAVDTVLSQLHEKLTQVFPQDATDDFSVCLGLDQDPYSPIGAGLYLYLAVPEELSSQLPKEWEQLDSPKEETMLWSTECYQ